MIGRIPLAWLQLVRQKVRFIVALAGITFIVILMFVQVGFQEALYSSATQVHRSLKGDLFLLSSQYKSLTSNQSFPRERLYQALGFNGVESVSPVYLQFAKFKNPDNGQKYSIYVMGFDPGKPVLNILGVENNIDKIKIPDVVLFDKNSRPEFGQIVEEYERGNTEQRVEVFAFTATTGYQVKIGGLFSLGPSFGVDGNLVVSDSTFLRIYQVMRRDPKMIDLGVISLKSGVKPQKVLQNLRKYLPKDVQIFTREGFVTFEKNYWTVRTPIGFTLNLMLAMGSIVGVVIVYQILHNNISTNLAAFATLKAIGYPNRYLLSVVFQQAILLAFLGYIPGFAFSVILYDFAKQATKLPMIMNLNQALIILMAASAMCIISGMLAIGKLRSADPADIF
ncbi:MAG: ABC transporter permease DevC [Scytonema sp. PMC 1070.18]|nr:ABC transporter permease DevC [Scytonema sp. PMC 1070.18]